MLSASRSQCATWSRAKGVAFYRVALHQAVKRRADGPPHALTGAQACLREAQPASAAEPPLARRAAALVLRFSGPRRGSRIPSSGGIDP
jgi:hypothetical protein